MATRGIDAQSDTAARLNLNSAAPLTVRPKSTHLPIT